jgi:hypothetical protein
VLRFDDHVNDSALFQSLMRAARDDPGVVGKYRAILAGGAAATCNSQTDSQSSVTRLSLVGRRYH